MDALGGGGMVQGFAGAVVGGTASVIGGGKFENGAMTGAFARLLNACGVGHGTVCGDSPMGWKAAGRALAAGAVDLVESLARIASLSVGTVAGVFVGVIIPNNSIGDGTLDNANAPQEMADGKYNNQNKKKPKNAPPGTLDIDKAKSKYGWTKDQLHGIKDAAHGGAGTGESWTGVAPDGTVGINEGGEWSPQGTWKELQ